MESPNRIEPAAPRAVPFPIVGIGASAGGLEALDEFLRQLPAGGGLALVVVQHLDPNRPGMMVELLQRSTSMKVLQAADRQAVKPGHVYVIPPGRDLSILRGSLFLFPPVEPHGRRLPIDFFFQSLASDRESHAIGIVLSGMGSDGLIGARTIKAKGGLVLVQDPASARSDGMPGSIVREGIADLVASPAGLAAGLVRILKAHPHHLPLEPLVSDHERNAFEKICLLLRGRSGHDFSLYKKSTVYRRIERRMEVHAIHAIADYVRFLQGNPQELDLLFKELLIGVTSFFRDPEAWRQLAEEAIPEILASHPDGHALRAWVAGCSTGEEAYSLAIAFKETLARLHPGAPFTLQIFATDLDRDAVEKARRGVFQAKALEGLSDQRRSTWFTQEEGGFRIHKEIREMLVFAVQDLIKDPPFIRLDLLLCRNLLIYLSAELQKQLLPVFHYSLSPGAWLFMGSAETTGPFPDLFIPHPGRARLFRRRSTLQAPAVPLFPLTPAVLREGLMEPPMPKSSANLQSVADQVLLQQFAPPAVLVNKEGDILYISGRTGKYLEPAMGKANLNIFAMAREGLRAELGSAFRKSMAQKDPVVVKGLRVGTNGGTQIVDLTVKALESPESLRGMVMIVFADQPAPLPATGPKPRRGSPANQALFAELEAEIKALREELRRSQEEMQTSQEELKATNEELQSTNEELQSTNEELTTSKEELQSLNEELQTVNAEQQAKVDELFTMNNDMKNLLDATDIATLFLDEQLNVRRFTKGATRLFKLISGDLGRPITDIVNTLDYPELETDIQEVMRSLLFCEKEVPTQSGTTWYSSRILPYRTTQNTIGGVVITFSDITRSKSLEAELRQKAYGRAGRKTNAGKGPK